MRFSVLLVSAFALISPSIAKAQCFNRFACADPSTLMIRSQISVNLPLSAQMSSADAMKAVEDARRDLYGLSNRECDTLKSIYGGECSLTEVNINSSIQDRSSRTAYVSISNTYQVKKTAK